jgi:hypothetical protein
LLNNVQRCGNLPLTNRRSLLSQHCMVMRQLTLLQSSPVRIRHQGLIQDLVGNDMWLKLQTVCPTLTIPPSLLYPIWDLGVFDLAHLLDSTTPRHVRLMPSDSFQALHGPRPLARL